MFDRKCLKMLCSFFKSEIKIAHLHEGSIQSLNICLLDLRQDKQIYPSEQNRSFMIHKVSVFIQELQKPLIYNYNKSKLQLKMDLSGQLHSIFEQSINTNITNIRTNNPQLLRFLQDISLHGYHSNISQKIYDLYCKDQIHLQLVELYSCNHILKSLKKHNITLSTICDQLRSIFTQKIVEREIEVYSQIEQPYQKHEYKLKLKSKIFDAFSSKYIPIYFSKYEHLFMVVKKNSIQSIKAKLPLQSLVSTLKSNKNLSILEGKVVCKVEQKNQWICINEVIQQLLPETHNQQLFLKQVQREFATSYHKSFFELTAIIIKKWQQTVTRILNQKRSQKKEIKYQITDWITVQLVFQSQTRLIYCLQQIKKWAEQSAAIIGLDGNLQNEHQLRLKIIVSQVCCTIKLKANHGLRMKRYKKVVRELFGQNRNIVFNVFLNAHKQHQNSLLSYLKEVAKHLQKSQKSGEIQVFNSIQSFVGQIDPIQNWDQFSRYQRNLTGSWIDSSKPRRSGQKLLTQVHFQTEHQIKTEQSVQTEFVNHAQLAQQKEKPKERVLQRTTSQNNIIHQSEKIEQNDISKRSMLLPSPTFNQPTSKKLLEKMNWKYANSEHESQIQIPDVSPTHQIVEPVHDNKKELEQIKAYLSQLKDNQEQLIAKHIQAISQKQTDIINLGKLLESSKRRQAELQEYLSQMKINYEDAVAKADQKDKQAISDKEKWIQLLSKKLQEKQNEILEKDSLVQQLKRQLFKKDQKIDYLQKSYAQIQRKEAQISIDFSRLQFQYKQKKAKIFEQNEILKEKIYTLTQQKQQTQRQKQENLQRITTFSQEIKQLNLKIQSLRSQNEDIGRKTQQLILQLQELKKETNNVVFIKNKQKQLAEAQFKKADQQLKALKIEYQTQKSIQCPCFQRRTAQKKLQYLKILFTILFFQAIGISFTLNILK